MKKKIIFWAIVVVLLIGLGIFLKYASLGVTVVTILVGLGGIVLGWIAHILYGKYVKQ